MPCYACRQVCPENAVGIREDLTTCIRLLDSPAPVTIDPETCVRCEKCTRACPLGNPAQSASTCSFCLICRGRTNCVILEKDRETLANAVGSLAFLLLMIPGIFLKKFSGPPAPAGH